jgi:large exoprotein involved in heme utilization and adhesion
MGTINLSQKAALETSADAAGRVLIRGGQLMMDDASIKAISMNGPGDGIDAPNSSPKISITAETVALSNGALITADSYGTAAAGDITLNVDTLTTQAGLNRLPLNPTNNFNYAGNFIASDSRSTDTGAGPAGNITIQGVGGSGTAARSVLLKDSTISSRIFGGTPTTRPSAITITADAVVLANEGLPAGGDAATIVANTLGTAPGGHVAFNVNTLRSNVNAAETPIAGAQKVYVISNNDPGSTAGPTGTITISGIRPESTDAAQLVVLNNTNVSTGVDGGNPRTAPGNITITTDTLSLINDTQIFTAAFGDGGSPAGNIFFNVNTLRANTRPDGTLITGVPPVLIASVSLVSGRAGNITISGIQPQTTDAARQLSFNNIELNTVVFGGTPQTAPAALTVTADNIHLTQSTKLLTDTQGGAPAGNILVTANTLLADDGSQISSSSSTAAHGGNIFITAGQSVTLNSGSSISASSTGPGNAGNILINAKKVMINGGATINASSTGAGNAGTVTIQGLNSPANSFLIDGAGSGVFTNTEDTGAGGSISINANAVTLHNGGTISASTSGTTSAATGGSVSISAGQFIQMNDGAAITASSTGPGNAGNIFIDAGPQLVMQNSSIKTEAAHSGGGDIEIRAVDLVQLGNSTVSTSVLGGTGSGGNITIDPNIVLLQNSQVIAQAVQGTGGNISITTNLLLPDSTSLISASSQFGQQGTISIQSPVAPASGKIIPLSQKPLIETALVSQRCAALAGGNASSFTVVGRDSLPVEPSGWLSSPLALTSTEVAGSHETGKRTSQREPSEQTPILSLRRIAPPGFLTLHFAADSSTGCSS